jgi:hypothetical protein
LAIAYQGTVEKNIASEGFYDVIFFFLRRLSIFARAKIWSSMLGALTASCGDKSGAQSQGCG